MSSHPNRFDPLPDWNIRWQAYGEPLPARWPGEMTLVFPQANQDPQQWGVMEHQWWQQWRQNVAMPSPQPSSQKQQRPDILTILSEPHGHTAKKRNIDSYISDDYNSQSSLVGTPTGPYYASPAPASYTEPPSKRRMPFEEVDVNVGVYQTGGRPQDTKPVVLDVPRYYDQASPPTGKQPIASQQSPMDLPNHYMSHQAGPREYSPIAHQQLPLCSGTPPSSVPAVPELPPAPVPVPNEPILCKEQAELVDLIVKERKNVFYTGSAGCGKSTVLKAFTSRLRAEGKKVYVVAPTGRAALQIGGMTTWTYAGMTPDSNKRELNGLRFSAKNTPNLRERFLETDVLVIDEISMVENFHFQRLNERMKAARRNAQEDYPGAFGGVQVIVTGDFCQLPPVKPFQHCLYCGKGLKEKSTAGSITYTCPNKHGPFRDEDKWAFKSQAWEECDFVHVNLKTIHRQNDQKFIKMLQKCRIGLSLTQMEVDTLMDHPCRVTNATKIYSTREEVRRVNQAAFSKLRAPEHTYACLDNFRWHPEVHPELQSKQWKGPDGTLIALADHRYEAKLELKAGMLVVLLHNLDLEAGLCNGSQGIICGFEQYDPAKLPKQVKMTGKKEDSSEGPRLYGDYAAVKEVDIKHFIDYAKDKLWPKVRFHNGVTRTIYADCSINTLGDEEPYSLLSRTQIPLAAAWAMTIHKSQSLTLDRVIVCLNRAFEQGQVYVALSRATGLHGLKIEGSAEGLQVGLGGNREVQRFLRENFGALNDFLVQS